MFCTISPSFILRDGSRLGFGSLHARASRVCLMPMEQHGESHWFPEQYVGPVAPWFGRTATFHVLEAAWSTPVPTPFRGSIPPFSTISRPWILPRWKALVSARLPMRLADTSSPRGRETSPLDVSLASVSSHPGRPPRFEPARPKGLKGDVSGSSGGERGKDGERRTHEEEPIERDWTRGGAMEDGKESAARLLEALEHLDLGAPMTLCVTHASIRARTKAARSTKLTVPRRRAGRAWMRSRRNRRATRVDTPGERVPTPRPSPLDANGRRETNR